MNHGDTTTRGMNNEGSCWPREKKHFLIILLVAIAGCEHIRSSHKVVSMVVFTKLGRYREQQDTDSKKTQHIICPPRNISEFPVKSTQDKIGDKDAKWLKHCLHFVCNKDLLSCDNTWPTNFDGPDPPCCIHLLRDMAREFDRIMCHLGLEYFSAYGTLLGLVREGRLIPWTIDNDYFATEQSINALYHLWNTSLHFNHGLSFFRSWGNRMCINPGFAQGRLARNWTKRKQGKYDQSGVPFADLFSLNTKKGIWEDSRKCKFQEADLWPSTRKMVYNNSFYQTFPNNANAVLTETYGESWDVPDAKKNPHGGLPCGKRKKFEARIGQTDQRQRKLTEFE